VLDFVVLDLDHFPARTPDENSDIVPKVDAGSQLLK